MANSMKLLFLSVLTVPMLLTISACASPPVPFHTLSDEEIAAYNNAVPFEEQVFCVKDNHSTGTWIRKRRCDTLQGFVDNQIKSVMTLNIVNNGPAIFE